MLKLFFTYEMSFYRLSPERVEDRPWVLVCAGPHWQGAIGIATARILASMGVHTCVCSAKEELQLCAPEEMLYNLSGEMFSRQIGGMFMTNAVRNYI